MATASESKIREELQKKKPRHLYVLVDEDPFRPEHYTELIFRGLQGGNRETYHADELNPAALLDQVRSPSLWGGQKFLLVKQGERLNAKQWEALLPLLQDPLDGCLVVIQAAKADARIKFFQALAKAPDKWALVKFDPSGDMSYWLQFFLRETGKEIDDNARDLLLEWTAGSLSQMRHMLERAALYAGEEKRVKREHVQAVGFRVAPEDIFRFTGRLMAGDRSASLVLLEQLLKQGEEPLALVGLLARQYRWLLAILAHRAEGKNESAIASATGIFPAAGKILFPAASRLGSKGVIRGLSALAETDHQLKSSRVPKDQLLTGLVMKLTQ